tara:strand:- start:208 stop:405 length:198 start_codon:yes stop_codon:yes gene_type:complete
MEHLEETLSSIHEWSRDRIHVLDKKKKNDDAYALFLEFEEWYDEDADDHDIFSLAYIGMGSTYEH